MCLMWVGINGKEDWMKYTTLCKALWGIGEDLDAIPESQHSNVYV